MKILNIHGLFGKSKNNIYRALLGYPDLEITSPQLANRPREDYAALRQIALTLGKEAVIIGKSLGGLYAAMLNRELSIPAILINPSFEPWRNNAFDENDSRFLARAMPTDYEPAFVLCLCSVDDTVVDHAILIRKYKYFGNISKYYFARGGHDFEFENNDHIVEFIAKKCYELALCKAQLDIAKEVYHEREQID